MSQPTVLRSDQPPIAIVTLNRPDKRNALSRALVASLSDALGQLAVEPGVRAIVITGAGPAFCSGLDLKEAASLDSSNEAEKAAVHDAQALADLIDQVRHISRPTIAALNGDALAGGAGLALACDIVIASAEARLGYPEVRRGLVAAIVMHDLIRQVGDRRARQLLLSGDLVPAHEADRWGLVNMVVPADRCLSEAIAVAHSFAGCAPQALATTKRLLDEAAGRPKNLRGAAAVTASVRVADEAREGIRAFLEKRPPSWAIANPGSSRTRTAS
jgi:methylglutaconyl-CoA hydratase